MTLVMKRGLVAAGAILLMMTGSLVQAKPKGTESGWLGVYTQSVDREMAEAFKLAKDYGAVVNQVVDDSPAEKAGLKRDDIIVAFNGEPVKSESDLVDMVTDAGAGSEATLTVIRGGNEISITAVLAERNEAPDRIQIFRQGNKNGGSWNWSDEDFDGFDKQFSFSWNNDDRGYLGVELLDISDEVARGLGAMDGGALVNKVVKDSPADKAGLKAGDIILAINGTAVTGSESVSELIGEMEKGDKADIQVMRNKSTLTFSATIDQADEDSWSFRAPRAPKMPDLPSAPAPRMRGLYRGNNHPDVMLFDAQDMQEELQDLKTELEALRQEIKSLKQNK